MYFKRLVFIALVAGPFSIANAEPASTADISNQASTEGCVSNCTMVLKHEGHYLFVAKNRSGDLLRTDALDIPADARHTDSSSESIPLYGDSGARQTTTTDAYNTPEGTWVVVTVITHDMGGNIIDVKSKTAIFPNAQEK